MSSGLEVRPISLTCEVEVPRQAAAADSVIFYLSGLTARFTGFSCQSFAAWAANVELTIIIIIQYVNNYLLLTK